VNLKQRLQQDMRDAMRAHDLQRVNVIRMLLAAFEHAQEAMGKEAFDTVNSDGVDIQPDRYQVLSEQAIQDIIRNEVQRRREAADLFRDGRQKNGLKSKRPKLPFLSTIWQGCRQPDPFPFVPHKRGDDRLPRRL
jgi:uncharacterized protein YqeY